MIVETDPPFPTLSDAELVAMVRQGQTEAFGELVRRHQSRLFAMTRRYARREDEAEDIVQEILFKAFDRLETWRGDAPFEHWLMRLAVRVCYDFLRAHQRSREVTIAELSPEESDWLDRQPASGTLGDRADAAQTLVAKVLERLSPSSRLIITLLELEDRSVKEVAQLTGWSSALVKVRAFRARLEFKKQVERMQMEKYL